MNGSESDKGETGRDGVERSRAEYPAYVRIHLGNVCRSQLYCMGRSHAVPPQSPCPCPMLIDVDAARVGHETAWWSRPVKGCDD